MLKHLWTFIAIALVASTTATAAPTRIGELHFTTISPSSISGTVANWSPTGLANATEIRISTSGAATITGIAAPSPAGPRQLRLCNVSSNAVTLANATGSSAANQFTLAGGDWIMKASTPACVELTYDVTLQKWRALAGTMNGITVTQTTTANFSSVGNSTPSWIAGNAGLGWYANNNELNQGYGQNAAGTGYINYGGYQGSTSQFRNTWIGNGKNAAAPILYTNGTNSRVGIGTASPAQTLDVSGTFTASGNANLAGGATSTAGALTWGPCGGTNGCFSINPTTGVSYFLNYSSPATYGVLGINKTNSLLAPIDIKDMTFTPGTSSPRTDTGKQLAMTGILTSQWDTTAADIYPVGLFYDMSLQKAAGTNKLVGITLRLDANRAGGSGGADAGVALWIDKGEFWNSGHYTEVVRASTTGYGPTQPPTVGTSCGTSPSGSVSGTDGGFVITVGGNSPTSCVMNFQMQFTDHVGAAMDASKIGCIVQAQNPSLITATSWTNQALTITSSGLSGVVVGKCWGTDNNIPLIP